VKWSRATKSVEDGHFAVDELVRTDTNMERLASSSGLQAGRQRHGGNASPYSDGAAAVVVVSDDYARAHGLGVLAKFVTFAAAGVEPDVMGVGPVQAVPKALKRAASGIRHRPH
jgi:acetyl-CoA acyltransferase